MPSTFSNLGLELQATGENANTWGQKTNVGLQRVDNAIAGFTTVQANSTTITLAFSTNSGSTTFTDENGRNKILKFTSGTAAAAITVTVPDIEKEYLVRNETGQNVTFSAGGATTVTIATGKNAHIYIDGASAVYNALADAVTTSLDTGAITTTGITTTGNINFGDNDKAQFGAGNDLQMYHDGSNSYIDDAGAGNLYIRATNLQLQNYGASAYLNANSGGSLTLYYNGNAKLATTSGGVDITGTANVAGNVDLRDSDKLLLGDSDDLQIYHNGSNSYIYDAGAGHLYVQGTNLWLTNADGTKNYLNGNSSTGNVSLYYGTDEKLRTTSAGFTAYGTVTSDGLVVSNTSGDLTVQNIASGEAKLELKTTGTTDSTSMRFSDSAAFSQGAIVYTHSTDQMKFYTAGIGNLRMTIDSSGNAIFDYGVLLNEGTLTDGATIAWDVNASPVAKVTLGGNRTISAPSNQAGSGQFISLLVIQDGTGSRTLTWNAIYEFKDDTAPTLTTTGGKGDLFVFRYYGAGSKWVEVGRNQNLSLS